MRYFLIFLFFFNMIGINLKGQSYAEFKKGVVSYVTKQNVYVKFQSTESISVGDTLFTEQNSQWIPALVVKNLSSISCFCSSISNLQMSVGEGVLARVKKAQTSVKKETDQFVQENQQDLTEDTISENKKLKKELIQDFSGRIAISSYSNFSSNSDYSQRMRYTLKLNAQNIHSSKLSMNTYISFAHKKDEWSEIQDNIYNGLKIYSLAMNYAFNENNSLWFGRKINPKLSSVGAIDGIQYETKLKPFTIGVFAGTRPDYMYYNFNSDLLQYGGYLGHEYSNQKGNMQSSVAFIQQTNQEKTDRRYVYFQHSNSLISNLYFFGSVDLDFYNQVMSNLDSTFTQENSPKLSSLYLSLRYRMFKKLSMSISYSARQNIIYYETYKDILERLLEAGTQQGYRLNINYRPFKNVSIGVNSGYRYSKSDPGDSKNLMVYLTYNNLPWLNCLATVSATMLQTAYVSGNIYSLGLSRDIISGKLYAGANYRYVDYNYEYDASSLAQNIAEMNLTWRIRKKLSLSLNYEGTFEKDRNTDRIYINLSQRF
ncbi:MAG: hypothetical protein GQ564_13890 [Bacteroidales bacterium]|nr:hypothetical protein [Bacteroidales bacterium]